MLFAALAACSASRLVIFKMFHRAQVLPCPKLSEGAIAKLSARVKSRCALQIRAWPLPAGEVERPLPDPNHRAKGIPSSLALPTTPG